MKKREYDFVKEKLIEKILPNANVQVERLFDDYTAAHFYGNDDFYEDYYVLTNENGEKTILRVEAHLELNYVLKNDKHDIEIVGIKSIERTEILLPYEKRDFIQMYYEYDEELKTDFRHILTTSPNGTGLYSLEKEKFSLEEGCIQDIKQAEYRYRILGEVAYEITNSEGKKGLHIANNLTLDIPVEYDEITKDDEMQYHHNPNPTEIAPSEFKKNIFFVRKGNKWGLYFYRECDAPPYDYNVYQKTTDGITINNNKCVIKVDAIYDKIEFFSSNGLFKIYLDNKVGLLDIYANKVIIPPVFDSLEYINYYMSTKAFNGYIDDQEYLILKSFTYQVYKATRSEMPIPENYPEIGPHKSRKREK